MACDVLIASEQELRNLVRLDLDTVNLVERAFIALAEGNVVMPPVLSMEIADHHGEVDVKTAYIPGFDGFAIKISPGFFNNPKLGLPSLNGLMVLFSSRTGLVEGLLLDNGYLTDIRTAAAGAVAARHLAPSSVNTMTVFGSGMQARLQVEAAYLVRPFERLLVCARRKDAGEACAVELSERFGIEARYATDPESAVAESELVVTTTPTREPLIRAEWLHPCLHITAMGSDQAGKNEIEPAALAIADHYVPDRVSQCRQLGELRAALDAGHWTRGDPAELGEIVSGKVPGRQSEDEITICDLTGTGAQDTAIATHAVALLKKSGDARTIKT